jgi:hypothetical protein
MRVRVPFFGYEPYRLLGHAVYFAGLAEIGGGY